MSTRAEIGQQVRQARKELGLSQADLGRLMSRQRSYAAISDMERGKASLAADELLELARILQKDLAYFYGSQLTGTSVYVLSRGGELFGVYASLHGAQAVSESDDVHWAFHNSIWFGSSYDHGYCIHRVEVQQ